MGGLFGGGSKPPPPPPPPPPPLPMPDPNDPAILAAKRREEMLARARSGRASTLLSGTGDGGSDKLGVG